MATWEGIAAAVLRETGLDEPPVDAMEVAVYCGLSLHPSPGASASLDLERGVLTYPIGARPRRIHGLVAHEIGHWALDWCGEPDSEAGASYIAGALLLPRAHFDRDLVATEWHLVELQRRHPNASAELIARRIVELRDAVVTVYDQGKQKRRVWSPWLGPEFAVTTDAERELADAALSTERVQRVPDSLLWAVPVLDGPHRRVIVVADAELLRVASAHGVDEELGGAATERDVQCDTGHAQVSREQ